MPGIAVYTTIWRHANAAISRPPRQAIARRTSSMMMRRFTIALPSRAARFRAPTHTLMGAKILQRYYDAYASIDYAIRLIMMPYYHFRSTRSLRHCDIRYACAYASARRAPPSQLEAALKSPAACQPIAPRSERQLVSHGRSCHVASCRAAVPSRALMDAAERHCLARAHIR